MIKRLGIFIGLSLLMGLPCALMAQKNKEDSLQSPRLNPRKATIYSAVLPGLGQIYNGKIWKTAVVYMGFGGITAGFVYNQKNYLSYQQAVEVRFDTLASTIDTKYPSLSNGTVQSYRNFHRRNRDVCILSYVALYALNIIDANVDAHLQEFKLNKDLSLGWQPSIGLTPSGRINSALALTLTF